MEKIDKIISSMTWEQKAAQLTQMDTSVVYQTANTQLTGAALRFGLTEETGASVGSVLNFCEDERADIQATLTKKSTSKIPLVFMLDVIHGYRTIFPIPLALGCTFDEEIVEDCAEMSAREARAAGVDVTFSPMVDLVRDCRWGRVMESTGEDHYVNGEMGKAFIRGYHKGGLGCCVKHFAAYGAPEAGREYNTVELSEYTLHEYYYYAYKECLKENPELFMSSFNVLNGKPVNGKRDILVDLLRKEWGFDGVLISDYNAVEEMLYHGFAEDRKGCAKSALNCEIDMEMMSVTYLDYLEELVREGSVPQETVDRMVERVLLLKEKLGLLDNPNGGFNPKLYQELCLSEKHRAIVRRAAEKSFVLLKNDGALPLKSEEKVALIGPFAEERNLLGAWRANGKIEETSTVKERLEAYLGKEVACAKGCDYSLFSEDTEGFAAAEEVAKRADTLLLCIGEYADYSGEGNSRANPNVPKAQVELVKRLRALHKRTVGIVFGGRPLILTEVLPYLDSILYVWQPGTEGANAIVNTLYGKNNPAGKTVMTFPRSAGQCPIRYNEFHGGRRKPIDDLVPEHCNCTGGYIDELNAPLFPFGFGLSYTRFSYCDLTLTKEQISKGEGTQVCVHVRNEGDFDGEEVVQLYIRDVASSFVRPVKELKGYQKIFLKKGESKVVCFDIDERLLSYHNDKGELLCEAGEFEIMVGADSERLLKKTLLLCF